MIDIDQPTNHLVMLGKFETTSQIKRVVHSGLMIGSYPSTGHVVVIVDTWLFDGYSSLAA